jgi:hypothetical protein
MENREDKHTLDTQPIPLRNVRENDTAETASLATETEFLPVTSQEQPDEKAWEQDRIPTPVPIEVPRQVEEAVPSRPRASGAMRLAVLLALVLGLTSLVLNILLITNLLTARQTFIDGVDQAIAAVDSLGSKGFHYEYRLQQTVPFEGDIPFEQDMVFPFKGNVPIKTTVKVPIDAGVLGKFVIDVPIDTNFPVDLQVPIHVSQTIHVATEIPLDLTVPIDVSPGDPAIQKAIDGIREWLVALRESF